MKPIPVNEPALDGREQEYVLNSLKTGWISSEGPAIKEFEEKFAARVGRKFGIAVANGTVALEAAALALRLPAGSEVILPSFTIISCAAAIVRAGLKPVFVDADPLTWNMDVAQAKAKINSRTKGIMPVHIYGLPVDMDPILDLAKQHGLAIIEDAAEMIGQTYNGRQCASFGDLSTVSFYPNKHITTGEGGMILTDNPELAERCRSLRNLCFKPPRRFVHDELGFNYRMTNLQASLGLAQLERLDEFLARKRRIGNLYQELLAGTPGLQLPLKRQAFAENIYWVFGIVLEDSVPYDAEVAMQKMAAVKVGTRPFFWPMHEQPVFEKMGLLTGERLPVSERIARRGFYLPSGLTLTDEDVREVAARVRETLK